MTRIGWVVFAAALSSAVLDRGAASAADPATIRLGRLP